MLAESTPGQPEERRTRRRVGFDCPIRWSAGGADRPGWARDVSDQGAGFVTRALCAPRPGERIRLVFEFDDEGEWVVDEHALVVRTVPGKAGVTDVGVRLSPLDDDPDPASRGWNLPPMEEKGHLRRTPH